MRIKNVKSLWMSLLFCLPFVLWFGARWYTSFMFDVNCGQHIKRAADSNTVELAHQEMDVAVSYLDMRNIKSGYTTIFTFLWLPPNEDVGFWYTNLKTSRDELRNFIASHKDDEKGKQVRQEQQAMVLMKLRQTLLDHTHDHGESVTMPGGIGLFPGNMGWFWTGWLTFFIGLVLGGLNFWEFFIANDHL